MILTKKSPFYRNKPKTRLIVLGSGKLDKETSQIISSRNLDDILFVDHVTNSIKMRYFKTCDIFCSPAIGNESFGIVLLEAMASGKPIIASDIPGYKSVLENNKQGILVPPKNESAIASSILKLLNTSEKLPSVNNKNKVKFERNLELLKYSIIFELEVDCPLMLEFIHFSGLSIFF